MTFKLDDEVVISQAKTGESGDDFRYKGFQEGKYLVYSQNGVWCSWNIVGKTKRDNRWVEQTWTVHIGIDGPMGNH